MESIILTWRRFASLTAARAEFKNTPCIYVQADREGRAIRIGMAGSGLAARYRGGTGHALDAAMHESGNVVFAASLDGQSCGLVEASLIWEYRSVLAYNRVGKLREPVGRVEVKHAGDSPTFVWEANDLTRSAPATRPLRA